METPPKIQIGIQTTCWSNDNFLELGNERAYQEILDQVKLAGFAGGSFGHNYPTHLPSLIHAFKSRDLEITSTRVDTRFTAPGGYVSTLQTIQEQISFSKAVGARDIVVTEVAGAVYQDPTKSVLIDGPRFNEPQWFLLCKGLNEAGKLALKAGLRLSFLPHAGTGIQDYGDILRLLQHTDPDKVFLCLDTGHSRFMGERPHDVARDQARRVGHVYLKNVRQSVVDAAIRGKYSYYQAIVEGIFTVPGDVEGDIDFSPIFHSLLEADYSGWIVVAAEQDPGKVDPLLCAQTARAYIRHVVGL